VEKNNVIKELKAKVQVDGMLTQTEKTAMKEALRIDRKAVIEETKQKKLGEIARFIQEDYGVRSLELV
jgi:uncharacterized protein YjcR